IHGNALANVLDGAAGNDQLYGGAGNDTLNGGDGNDLMQGGLAADTMAGGLGDDTYYVDNAGDVVTENTGEGTDAVHASVRYTLSETLAGPADSVTNFSSSSGAGTNDDRLHLSASCADAGTAGDQAFTWGQLTPAAHGIWIGGVAADGSVIMYGDVNGVTAPDF